MGVRHAQVARSLGLETYTVDPHREADFDSLRGAPPAEVIAVATPISRLAAVALDAIEVGCERLLVEKPMTATVADAHALIAAARETGTRLLVGYSDRFDALVDVLKRELDDIGSVERMSFERWGPHPSWVSPGPAVDLAVHDLDLIRHFGFEPSLLALRYRDDSVRAELRCGPTRALLSAGYRPWPKVRRISIAGAGGTLECDLIARALVRTGSAHDQVIELADDRSNEPLVREWEALLSTGGPDGDDGLAALSLALELTEAVAGSAPVSASGRPAGRLEPGRQAVRARP
jgi:predicted dehydrogenase